MPLLVRSIYDKQRSVLHDNKVSSNTVVVRLMCSLDIVLYIISN